MAQILFTLLLFLSQNVQASNCSESLSELETIIPSFSESASVTVQAFGEEPLSCGGKSLHPTASNFKLYVLGALSKQIEDGKKSWDLRYPIQDKFRSFGSISPGNNMDTWPTGKKASLLEFATYMMALSDNTATDHLIHILGRREIEKIFPLMGNSFASMNKPVLSTTDIFRLKWAASQEVTEAFIQSSEAEKRTILKDVVSKIPLTDIGKNGVDMTLPTHIMDIEYFASTEDLCRAHEWLKNQNDSSILYALSRLTPGVDTKPESHWQYAGFKGGQEPGVLTATYLLQSKTGRWGCVAIAWHNTKEDLESKKMYGLMVKTLELAKSHID